MVRLEMKKLRYDINTEAAKISTLSSGKIDKYKFLQVTKYLLVIKDK